MKKLRNLLRDTRGLATVEFALASLFLFGVIVVGLDFAFAAQQKLRLDSAVGQAAVLAYNQQTAADTSAINNYVKAAAGTKTVPTVAITCNATTCGDGKCSCVTAAGGFSNVATCNAACVGSNAISGNYLKIVATMTYTAVIVPNKWLGGKTMRSTAVVRLQ